MQPEKRGCPIISSGDSVGDLAPLRYAERQTTALCDGSLKVSRAACRAYLPLFSAGLPMTTSYILRRFVSVIRDN